MTELSAMSGTTAPLLLCIAVALPWAVIAASAAALFGPRRRRRPASRLAVQCAAQLVDPPGGHLDPVLAGSRWERTSSWTSSRC